MASEVAERIETIDLHVEGMDCACEAEALERELGCLSGVTSCAVDAVTGRARVSYDVSQATKQDVMRSVSAAGLSASLVRDQKQRSTWWRERQQLALYGTGILILVAVALRLPRRVAVGLQLGLRARGPRRRLLPGAQGDLRPAQPDADHPSAHAHRLGGRHDPGDVAGGGHPDLRLLPRRRARVLRGGQGQGSHPLAHRAHAQGGAGARGRPGGRAGHREHPRRGHRRDQAGGAYPRRRQGRRGLVLRRPGGRHRRVDPGAQEARRERLRRDREPERLARGQVDKPASETMLSKIIMSVEEAQAKKTSYQTFSDNFAKYYTPAMFVLGVLVAVVPPLFFGADWHTFILRGLVVFVVSCSCGLALSVPTAVVAAMANAARHGTVFKGGAYLEAVDKVKAIAFDKTGTLTIGRPEVTDVRDRGRRLARRTCCASPARSSRAPGIRSRPPSSREGQGRAVTGRRRPWRTSRRSRASASRHWSTAAVRDRQPEVPAGAERRARRGRGGHRPARGRGQDRGAGERGRQVDRAAGHRRHGEAGARGRHRAPQARRGSGPSC